MRKLCSYSSSKPKASPIEFTLSRSALQRLRDLFHFTPLFSSNRDYSAALMQMVVFMSCWLVGWWEVGRWGFPSDLVGSIALEKNVMYFPFAVDIHTTNTELKILREYMLRKFHKMIPSMQIQTPLSTPAGKCIIWGKKKNPSYFLCKYWFVPLSNMENF